MTFDEHYEEDEDWYDEDTDDAEPDDDGLAPCPECGSDVYREAAACSACGYWLSDADRRAMWAGEARPAWQKLTAVVVLVAFLLSVLGLAAMLL